MDVGFVVFANKWTGAGAVAELSCRALHAANADAQLLFVGGRNLERRLTSRPWALPGLTKERRPAHLLRNLRAVRTLAENSDVLVCHLPHDHFLCVVAGVHRRVPLVRAFRNPRHIRRDPYHLYLNRRLSGALLAHSAMEGRLRRAVGRPPTVALPVPIDDSFEPVDGSGWRTRLEIPSGHPVIGTVGKLATGRGFGLLLETASQVESPVHVVVVGHGEDLPRLEKLAVDLGLQSRVHWVGYQDQTLPELYAAMDVVLFTAPGSDWGHRAVSEAQSCGRPVIAVSFPGVKDLIDDGVNGRIADHDPAALAAVVDALFLNPEAARRFGSSAAAAAAARRMRPVGEGMVRFLEGVLFQKQLH